MKECEDALQQLKIYLTIPPLLSKPLEGETIFLYLAVSNNALSVVLVHDIEGKQHPVYYVSKTLVDAKIRYTQLEKLALALVIAGKKLSHIFKRTLSL